MKNLLRLTLFFFAFNFSKNLLAQPAIQWDRTYGGNQDEQLNVLKRTPDGGYILGGPSQSPASADKTQVLSGASDFWIVKLNADGTKAWDKTYGGDGTDDLYSLGITSDGGYILGGFSNSGISGDKTTATQGYWIVKLSSNGTVMWDKSVGGAGLNELILQQTTDGGYILGGYSASGIGGDKSEASRGEEDYWIVKLDENGAKVWDKTYGGTGHDFLFDLKQTRDGGFIVTGYSNSPASADKADASSGDDAWVIKLDANGLKMWEETIGGSGFDGSYCIEQTADDGFIIGISSTSGADTYKTEESRGGVDYWVVKVDENGAKEWDKTIGGTGYDFMHDVIQTLDGGYLLGGNSSSYASGDKSEDWKGLYELGDFWVVKLNDNGTIAWENTIGGAGDDYLRSVGQLADGSYILGGFGDNYAGDDKSEDTRGGRDFWVVKLAAESPMPVTLTQFTAQKENNTALLTWTTTSETRSDRFEIQHSNNGKSWNLLGTVNAKGESTDLTNYQYVDTNPVMGSENLYRLKMIDTDGTFANSKINSLTFDSDLSVNMFPNPVSEILTIKMSDWKDVENVQLINSQSAIVYKSTKQLRNEVNVAKFSPGVYSLKITKSDGTYVSHKVVVVR